MYIHNEERTLLHWEVYIILKGTWQHCVTVNFGIFIVCDDVDKCYVPMWPIHIRDREPQGPSSKEDQLKPRCVKINEFRLRYEGRWLKEELRHLT